MEAKEPYKPKGFFKPGNTYGKGRPKISLTKPDVLLPAIFNKANINWAADFTRAYKKIKSGEAQAPDLMQFKLLLDLLPYLIVKVQLKEGDLKAYLDKGGAVSAAKATSALLRALENESNGAKPRTNSPSKESGMGGGESILPPTPKPADPL